MLANLQKEFLAFLQDKPSKVKQLVTTETPGLAIYKNAYHQRLKEALDTDFPCLGKLLGDDLYDQLIAGYIKHMPSTKPSLRWFGSDMQSFLKHHPLFSKQPIVIELANWEWQLRAAFDAAGSKIITLEQLATIAPEQWPTIQLKLVPSLRVLQYQTNVVNIWQSLEANHIPPAVEQNTSYWLIWRKELVTQFRSVFEDEWQIIQLIIEGVTFADICEQLCRWHSPEQAPQRAAQIIQQLTNDQVVMSAS
ncbi:putative DNA-binding domain-containing protein [Endozoicomonas sp. SM1973]|uniref:DNA-binding domain-containing protein n=1 Tax=Spartinivicinus marinus TaxID=2994442 RepID=A0A853I8L4_9GAMM|nr:DNA-binding domain-containing protein [Spartinivicinus marinus]MCX4027401.1 DNA-binding domain-containing protein [Spartinivicinus marinus]NYZ66424.1 putative DNA-binding domain-containing protein [Spartinivicinus marinus]